MLLHSLMLFLFTLASTMAVEAAASNNSIAKPGCPTHCGNTAVSYPFGFGNDTSCSLKASFHLTCNTSFHPPKLYLRSTLQSESLEIYNISDTEIRVFTRVSSRCYGRNGNVTVGNGFSIATDDSLFTFSEKNKFTVVGCDDIALNLGNSETQDVSSCTALCFNFFEMPPQGCSGNGCCQTSLNKGVRHYSVKFLSLQNHEEFLGINDCGYAFLAEENTFRFRGQRDLFNSSDLIHRVESNILVVINWVVPMYGINCSHAPECKDKIECYGVDGGGYRCRCIQGYAGNPYLDQGCFRNTCN